MNKIVLSSVICALSLFAAPKLYTVGSGSGSSNELSGVVYSKNESAVSSKISGYIKKIYVEEGESVKKGAPLFEIDTASTQAATLSANANLISSKAAMSDAKKDLERYKNLFDKGVVSEKEFERAKLNYDMKLQMYKSSEAMLGLAKNEQGYAFVRAPIDGVVLKKYLTVASLAMPGQPVLLLSGKNDLRIKADISEAEAMSLKVGDVIKFGVSNMQKDAKVISVAPNGAGARNFSVRAEPKDQAGLYSGMFVKIYSKTSSLSASIPVSAITKRAGIVGVFEYQNGIAKFRTVKVKNANGEFASVEGISSGVKIIENPKESLTDGQRAE